MSDDGGLYSSKYITVSLCECKGLTNNNKRKNKNNLVIIDFAYNDEINVCGIYFN
jgi:hypothetical protein